MSFCDKFCQFGRVGNGLLPTGTGSKAGRKHCPPCAAMFFNPPTLRQAQCERIKNQKVASCVDRWVWQGGQRLSAHLNRTKGGQKALPTLRGYVF